MLPRRFVMPLGALLGIFLAGLLHFMMGKLAQEVG